MGNIQHLRDFCRWYAVTFIVICLMNVLLAVVVVEQNGFAHRLAAQMIGITICAVFLATFPPAGFVWMLVGWLARRKGWDAARGIFWSGVAATCAALLMVYLYATTFRLHMTFVFLFRNALITGGVPLAILGPLFAALLERKRFGSNRATVNALGEERLSSSVFWQLGLSEATWLHDFWRWYWRSFYIVCLIALVISLAMAGDTRIILFWLLAVPLVFAVTILPAAAGWGMASAVLRRLGSGPRITVFAAGVVATVASLAIVLFVSNTGMLGSATFLVLGAMFIGTVPLVIVGPICAAVQAMKKPAG